MIELLPSLLSMTVPLSKEGGRRKCKFTPLLAPILGGPWVREEHFCSEHCWLIAFGINCHQWSTSEDDGREPKQRKNWAQQLLTECLHTHNFNQKLFLLTDCQWKCSSSLPNEWQSSSAVNSPFCTPKREVVATRNPTRRHPHCAQFYFWAKKRGLFGRQGSTWASVSQILVSRRVSICRRRVRMQ